MELSDFRKLPDDEKLEMYFISLEQKMEVFSKTMEAFYKMLNERISALENRRIVNESPFKTPPVSPIRPTYTSVVEMSNITFQMLATPTTPSRIAAFPLDETTLEDNSDDSYYSDNSYYSDEDYYSDDVPCFEDCPIQELEYLVPKSYTPTPDDDDSEADQYDEDPPAYTFDDSDDDQFSVYDDDDPQEQDQFSTYDDDDPEYVYEEEDQVEDEDESFRDY